MFKNKYKQDYLHQADILSGLIGNGNNTLIARSPDSSRYFVCPCEFELSKLDCSILQWRRTMDGRGGGRRPNILKSLNENVSPKIRLYWSGGDIW